jgi:AhpD family alkylhydroperoxidase
MPDRGFTDLTERDADERGRAILASTRAELGSVPPAVARIVHAPSLFDAFLAAVAAFERTSFSPLEREAAVLVLARDYDCSVCRAMHTHIATRLGARPLAAQILAGAPPEDARLAALVDFVAELLRTRGDVPAATWESFLGAGFTRAQALELLIGVGALTMSIFANRLTGAHAT